MTSVVSIAGNRGVICLLWDSDPRPALRHRYNVNQRFWPFGYEGLIINCGLMSFTIVGYKLINYHVTNRVKLIVVTCVFELTVRPTLFLSPWKF